MDLLHFGPFCLDRAAYALSRTGPDGTSRRIALRPKAFDVLRYLVEQAGRVVTPEEFLAALWPGTHVQPEVLKSHVLAVRTALDDRTAPAAFIKTVRCRGYCFVAAVRAAPVAQPEDCAAPAFLAGRAAARSELDLARQRARSGEAQLVFLTGEAGIGKTSLVEAFARSVRENGDTVVVARCHRGSGTTIAYHPVLEILAELNRRPVRPRLATILEELAPSWLMPAPALVPAGEAGPHGNTGATMPLRMAHEVCGALAALARSRLLVLVLEDIHWADQATLDLIHLLAGRRLRTQLMVVASLRSPEPAAAGEAAGTLVRQCSLYRLAREIKLAPLTRDDVAAFLERVVGPAPPAALTRHLYARSEGNPLFLRAMLDQLIERNVVAVDETGWRLADQLEIEARQAPFDLMQLIEREIASLTIEAQSVLEAASLADGPFSPLVHHVASDLDEQAFEAVCESLARRGPFVRRDDVVEMPTGERVQTYVFRRVLFRDVAHDRQGCARRAGRHGAIASRLEHLFGNDLACAAAAIAGHWLQARRRPQAIRCLRMASRSAMRRFEMHKAVAFLEQATALCRNLPGPVRYETEKGVLEEPSGLDPRSLDKAALPTGVDHVASANAGSVAAA